MAPPEDVAGEKTLNDIHAAVRTLRGLTYHAKEAS